MPMACSWDSGVMCTSWNHAPWLTKPRQGGHWSKREPTGAGVAQLVVREKVAWWWVSQKQGGPLPPRWQRKELALWVRQDEPTECVCCLQVPIVRGQERSAVGMEVAASAPRIGASQACPFRVFPRQDTIHGPLEETTCAKALLPNKLTSQAQGQCHSTSHGETKHVLRPRTAPTARLRTERPGPRPSHPRDEHVKHAASMRTMN